MLIRQIKFYLSPFLMPAIVLLALVLPSSSFSQQKPNNPDSGWIEQFQDKIVLKTAILNTSEVLAQQGDGFRNVLQPNPSEIFRAYVNYHFISFYVSYIPHFLPGNNDNTEKGKSSGIGMGTTFNFRNWYTDLFYGHTKGYYLQNTKDYRPDWQPGDPYFQVPDLHTKVFEGSTGYNTNPRLSLRAITTQTERQLKSTGAFIPRLSYKYQIIDNRTTGTFSTQKSNNLQALLGAGYHHTFVFRKSLYLTGSFTPSFGYVFTKVITREQGQQSSFKQRGPVYQWDGRLGFGYNGHRLFTGAYLTAVSSTHAQGLTTAVNQDAEIFLQLFLGIRLNAPGFIQKNYEKVFH